MDHPADIAPDRPWFRRYTKLVAAATLCLIFLGGQVTSHDAGLSVPDWPTTYGQNMFAYPFSSWVGNIFHEHLHRLVATSVGVLCIGLAVWMARVERRRWARWLGVAALGIVIVQGLFGGLTVYLLLPAWVSTTHALLAQTFFLLTLFIAYTQSLEGRERAAATGESGSWREATPALILLSLVYLQLLAGALMRHTGSGLAIPDFPAMAGGWRPWFDAESLAWVNAWRADYAFETGQALDPVTLPQVWIHFVHRAGAVLVTLGTLYAAARAWARQDESPAVFRTAFLLIALVLCQIMLGIVTVLSHKVPFITSLHVVTGAATLGCTALLALRAMPLRLRPASAAAPLPSSLAGSPAGPASRPRSTFGAYLELTKPRIAVMVLVTAALGYYLNSVTSGVFPGWGQFALTLLGIGMSGGGASALNQYLERDVDARMERTRGRPLPSGRLTPAAVLYFGVALALGGCFLLLWKVNLLAAFLTLQSAFLYVLVYTPMKRLTWWNTSIGAVPGAMPPLIGWAAATGTLDAGAWMLFAVLYLWQHPHFFAIAWMYRDDYARGGLKMLPVVQPGGRNMFAQVILFSVVLIPVSLAPWLAAMTGWTYFIGAMLLGLMMLAAGIAFTVSRTHDAARRALRVSLLYLPGLLLAVWLDAVVRLP
jgi:protoheme IX farnesyltransferase